MPLQYVRIAGVTATSNRFPETWEKFAADPAPANMSVSCTAEEIPHAVFPKSGLWDVQAILQRSVEAAPLAGGGWLLRNPLSRAARPVRCSPDYGQITVFCPDDDLLQQPEALSLLRPALECRFCRESVVSLHAACVVGNSFAVCLTGDSGVGKSTRAQAWVQALDAALLSGDRPALRLQQSGCTVCGVPWDGKEQIFRNLERPLSAILEVRRAPFTRLRRLSADQAFGVLLQQCFLPMWDPDTAALAMLNVRRLCRTVPVYRLFCGPDAASAREAHDLLFETPEKITEELPDMQIKEGFVLRSIGEEHMVLPTGDKIAKFGGAVVLNDTAAFLFEHLRQPISREDLLALLISEFDTEAEAAGRDLDELLDQFREMEILDG